MIRGTTPTLSFTLPVDKELISKIYITMNQKQTTVIEKDINNCVINGNKASIKLSQAETLSLKAGYDCEIQLRIKTKGGDSITSNPPIVVKIDDTLKEGEI